MHIVLLNILVYLILFFNPCLQLICILTISIIAFPFLVTLRMLTDRVSDYYVRDKKYSINESEQRRYYVHFEIFLEN